MGVKMPGHPTLKLPEGPQEIPVAHPLVPLGARRPNRDHHQLGLRTKRFGPNFCPAFVQQHIEHKIIFPNHVFSCQKE